MQRILSAAVLIPVFFGSIWFLPTPGLLLLALVVLLLAFIEYAGLADALGVPIARVVPAAAAMAVCIAVGIELPLEIALSAALIALGALVVGEGTPGPQVLGRLALGAFPMLYLGVPLGALVALHAHHGREAVTALLVTIVVSDSAQYFTGRACGRRKLSPAISPKKTVEGAVGGFVLAPLVLLGLAPWWLPGLPAGRVLLLGVALVGLGIVGDLFESLIKRSAGVKDSSALIPGHGGVLDRIDALLFAAPLFYVFLRYGT